MSPGASTHPDAQTRPLWHKVWAGMGANGFGQAVTIGIQLVSLPIFLHYWTLQEYGTWLLVSAIPAYFALADVGIGTVAMNTMTMLAAQGRHREANGVFQTALAMTALSTLLLLAVALMVIWSFNLGPVRDAPMRFTISFLAAVALIGTFTPLFDGLFRASGQFVRGTMAIHVARLAEWAGGIAGLVLHGTMVAVALGFLLTRLAIVVLMVLWTSRRFSAFKWSIRDASIAHLRDMLPKGAAFLALPVGNALLLQGVTLVVGSTFGAAAVATFNSYRTLSRIPVQLLTTFSRSLWPELSRSYGAGEFGRLERLYRQSSRVSLLACAGACVLVFFAGPVILEVWSRGKIAMDASLLGLFLAAALAGCAWQVEQVLLSATNTHIRLSGWYFGAALMVMIVAVLLPPGFGMGAVAGVLIGFELLMLAVSRRLVSIPLRGGN